MNTQDTDTAVKAPSVIDVKKASKRAKQLGYMAIVTGLVIGAYYFTIGLMGSAYIDFGFSLSLSLVLVFHEINIIRKLQFYVVLVINLLLVFTAVMEGTAAGQYMYFFPLLVFIPCIVDFKTLTNREIIGYYALSIFCFIIATATGYLHRPYEYISAAMYHQIFVTNTIMAFVITNVFAFAYTYFEHKYINRIVEGKNNAVASRTRFLSTMGHELRTPLNGIIGAINVLKEEGKIDESNQYFQILKYCSDHMLKQVNDILDFNKIEAGKLEIRPVKVNLKQLLDNATLPFYNHFEEKKLQLKIEVDPRLNATVLADDIRLIQILNNLLSNALKFTTDGFVRLKVSVEESTEENLKVNFSVFDTGMGIDEEDQQKIFYGFWQVYDQNTRYINGTGLGLTICVRLLDMMNSKLNLVSKKNYGSEFSFDINFERHIEDNIISMYPAAPETNDLSGNRVLIVEDNMINMMIAKKTLSGLKAQFTTATNGQEALDALAKDAAYNIVLLDLEMPVMNGYETIGHLRELYPHLPVLAFTASLVDQQMLSDLVAGGFSDVILKPFQPHQLLSQIKEYAVTQNEALLQSVPV